MSLRASLRWAALRSAIALSVLFLIAYGLTNWFTSTRDDTRVWMYEWERFIPFVPLMVIPYLSIDAFFVAAPFLCTTRRELQTLSRRLAVAIFLACAIFLILPFRLGVDRPPASGVLGAIFDWFRAMDHPHNLFPSLHITLRFLGEIDDATCRSLRGPATEAAAAGSTDVCRLSDPGCFPSVSRPRVLWLGVDGADTLGGVVSRLEASCRQVGLAAEALLNAHEHQQRAQQIERVVDVQQARDGRHRRKE